MSLWDRLFSRQQKEQPVFRKRPDPPKGFEIPNHELVRVNEERKRRKLRTLTETEASAALRARYVSSRGPSFQRDTSLDFLIGLETGIPMPSAGGFAGAMLHNATHHDEQRSSNCDPAPVYSPSDTTATMPDTTPSYSPPDTTPSYSAPDPSPSFDSGGGGGGGDSGSF